MTAAVLPKNTNIISSKPHEIRWNNKHRLESALALLGNRRVVFGLRLSHLTTWFWRVILESYTGELCQENMNVVIQRKC